MKRDRGVSIVVLTHNQLEYTKQCFDSLFETTENYQLVVVDNASTDGTREYLRALDEQRRNVKVVYNDSNRGFAGGCNQGVSAARFEIVCLLNNDTIPGSGWLDEMKRVLGKGVGAVGSKLLLPDRSLQHAGICFVYRPSPAPHYWPYHRFLKEPENTPEANRLEEVPAVTAACLLTTKKVWSRVGGMDEGYLVANFEDVDFNLAVRDAGYKVLYQPKSVLTHYWGTTVDSKGDAEDSPKHHVQRNYGRLMDKWFDKLRAGLAQVEGVPNSGQA